MKLRNDFVRLDGQCKYCVIGAVRIDVCTCMFICMYCIGSVEVHSFSSREKVESLTCIDSTVVVVLVGVVVLGKVL